jgi:hypothetical protein
MKRIWMVRMAAYQPRPFSVRSPNFARELLDPHARDDHVDDDHEDVQPERGEPVVDDGGVRNEAEQDHDQHERHEQLARVPSAVDEVADESALRAAVANGQVLLLAVGHADAGTLALRRQLGLRAGARLLRVGDERALAGGLLLGARRRRTVLAGSGGTWRRRRERRGSWPRCGSSLSSRVVRTRGNARQLR